MLDGCRDAKERWGGVHDLLDRWLHERHELVKQYMSANGIEDFQKQSDTPVDLKIKELCQTLMDYCSAWHFEIYEQLLREAEEFDDGSADIIAQQAPKLEINTQALVDFNDKYDTQFCESDLIVDLSNLGQLLDARFELEDVLIKDVHEAHRQALV